MVQRRSLAMIIPGIVAVVIVVAVLALRQSVPQVTNTPALAPTPAPAADPQPLPAVSVKSNNPLAWFDSLTASGKTDLAVRAALARLQAEGPLPLGSSVARDQLLARLLALLPTLPPDLANEVAIALVKQPLPRAEMALVLAKLGLITKPEVRVQALRRLLEQDLPAAELIPLLSDADPRVRAAAAAALRRQAGVAPEAAEALAAAARGEVDPRVRQALTAAPAPKSPTFPEDRHNPVVLPSAAQRVAAKTIESTWDPKSEGKENVDYRCHSIITIDESGVAHVETKSDDGGSKWHVRYDGWAWKDAAGNVIIDARGQKVHYLEGSDHQRGWSPDSMTISPDGTTTTIDDRHQSKLGQSGLPGAG
jgi:hypothetical protein